MNQQDSTVYEKEKDIISVCRQVTAACDDILTTSPEAILTHTAQLESVDLVPVSPGDKLGIEIASTGSSNHYVTGAAAEPSSDVYLKILAGDEVIQVNDQIVVGWSRANLIKKLQENPSGVTLVLKKIPESVRRTHPLQAESSEEEEEKDEENLRHSLFERVAASVRSLSFSLRISPRPGDGRSPSPRSPSPFRPLRSPSLQELNQDRASISSCPEMGKKDREKTSLKGQTTAMSRRRVSCRELGKPDCDGWLWKKRKESSVFIAQKWQRFCVFKMYHQRFQNFFFAADNVNDMSKWINYLITTIQKHKKQKGPDSEEECYSETESESERSPSPRRKKKVQSNTLPRQKWKNRAPLPSPLTGGSKGTVDEMGAMMNSIKEGGVSLTGQEQPFTHDHFRRSFIRRCKNPVINEKVHTLRTLQSTLKAKEAELLQISKILDDSEVTASKFRQWKEQNEELVQEIERTTSLKASKDGDPTAESSPTEEPPSEPGEAGTEGAYRWSLSDGEQLVDAEPSDVLLEMGSPGLETSPMLELSLGSLQESINKELSDMASERKLDRKLFLYLSNCGFTIMQMGNCS
ncbi:hypothetical protein fugu_016417 [Takifugu bimaculatus]|uniref:PDZ domain-containing protein n=1 Tax=Takifugu bimaculatus TaxID=433685 RepID=A0A4Z2BSX6_9TELE|nr:hypothetical protein fugu_016417 [Takifugu bimaculatus]